MAGNDKLDALLSALDAASRRDNRGNPTSGDSVSFLGNAARQFAQGLTFNLSDEAVAYLRAAFGGETYDRALESERSRLRQGREQYPITSTVAEIGGAVAPAIPALIAAPATGGASAAAAGGNLAMRIGRGAVTGAGVGAASGAVSGFGAGEGGLANRLDSAAEGGVAGGIGGGVIGGAIPAVAGAVRRVTTGATDRARDAALNAFEREGITPDQALGRFNAQQLAMGPKPETIADLLPNSSVALQLEGALNNVAGAQRTSVLQRLADRMDDSHNRILQDFENAFGKSRGEFYSNFNALEAARAAQARPYYDRAYSLLIDNRGISSDLLRMPDAAFSMGAKIARTEGDQAAVEAFASIRDAARKANTNPQARQNFLKSTVTEVRTLDYIKRGLDAEIQRNTDSISGKPNPLARALMTLRTEFLSKIDNLAIDSTGEKVYQRAREIWGGASAQMDAMRLGQKALTERAEVLRSQIATMTQGEKESFLIGVMDHANQMIGRVKEGHDASGKIGMTANSRAAIEAAMTAVTNDPAKAKQLAQRLVDQIERESQMARTTRELIGNSRTALRQAAQADNAFNTSALGGIAMDLAFTGGAMTGLNAGGRLINRTVDAATKAKQNAELVRILGAMGDQEVTASLQELAARQQRLNELQRRVAGPQAALGGMVAGNLFGG